MRDALGAVETVLVLGGTSEIALATVRALLRGRTRTVVLAVRDVEGSVATAEQLRRAGAARVEVVAFDAARPDDHRAAIDAAFDLVGDIDLTILAFGVLGEQADFDDHPDHAVAAAEVNYVGAVSAGLVLADRIRRQGHGTLVVLSSVAGIRPRRTNFVYGSTKAGLDAFAQGLGDALVDSGGRVMVVRPGFVHTRMTAGMQEQPFATTADAVAEAVVRGLQRNQEIVYAPGVLRWVFAVMRVLPRPVWRIVSKR